MSKVLITRSKLDGLATTIAAKSGATLPLTIAQMDAAVESISGVDVEALSVTSNGTYTAPTGTAYSPVTVAVPTPSPSLQSKSATPTESQQTVTPDSGYDGLSSVTVAAIPSEYIVPSGTKSITENGTGIDVAQYATVDVAVPSIAPSLQSKSATPTESTQTITPDSGYDGLSSVSVGAISSTYVGSGITQRSSSDLTASGATVTVPAGYYSAQASKAVASGSATVNSRITTTPSVSIDEDGLVTARLNGSVGAMPVVTEGYITAGTTGSISYSGSKTLQLDTQATKTVTPSTSAQTAVAAGKYTTGAVTVAAMPSGTAGTPTATKGTVSNHSVSVTPSVTNATGYITGGTKTGTAVTVSASELVSGSETKTANGTYDVTNLASLVVDIPFVTYHTSTSAPTSSQGSNGDIWLVTE